MKCLKLIEETGEPSKGLILETLRNQAALKSNFICLNAKNKWFSFVTNSKSIKFCCNKNRNLKKSKPIVGKMSIIIEN